jgi:hypothetical protein
MRDQTLHIMVRIPFMDPDISSSLSIDLVAFIDF